jgi:hypothetical protein
VVAVFDNGSPAVIDHAYGKGLAIAVLPSAADMSRACAPLMRDVLERALAHAGWPMPADIEGLSERSDVAVTPSGEGLSVTVVNHEPTPRSIVIRPRDRKGAWIDAMTNRPLESSSDGRLRIAVPAAGVVMSELRDER